MASRQPNALAGLRMMFADQDSEDEVNDEDVREKDKETHEPNKKEKQESSEENCAQEDEIPPVQVIVPGPTTPKPLKSILKKSRMQDVGGKKEERCEVPPKKPNFGGSIAHALKIIKESQMEDKSERKVKGPQPSAFVLEMEKQKDLLPTPMPEQEQREEQPFFIKEKLRLMMKRSARKSIKKRNKKSIATEKKRMDQTITKGKQLEDQPEEYVILITNLPYKATAEQLVSVLGIWPKGGLDGMKLMTDSIGSPSGRAYIVLERHSHMMDVIRLTGLNVDGCMIRVSLSSRNTMMQDVKITETALGMIEHSKVVRVSQLPLTLGKSELIKCLDCVSFTEEDIYWKPLQKNQQNSGRGFIVLSSSIDAKKVSGKLHIAKKRKLEIYQSHPEELKRFCEQCDISINHKELFEPFGEFKDNVPSTIEESEVSPSDKNENSHELSTDCKEDDQVNRKTNIDHQINENNTEKREDLNICEDMDIEVQKEDDAMINMVEESVKQSNDENRNNNVMEKLHPKIPHGHQRFNTFPNLNLPFPPTVYVRMYNVPSKATRVDIQNFFSPCLPAKISQNLEYDICDIEFHSVQDALFSMNRNGMLVRRNTVRLEILPRPPAPLPPRPVGFVAGRTNPTHPMPILRPGFGTVSERFGFTPPPFLYNDSMGLQGTIRHLASHGREKYNRIHVHPPKDLKFHPPLRSSDERTLPVPESPVDHNDEKTGEKARAKSSMNDHTPEIMVPPLPEDFTNYIIPKFSPNDPIGQAVITPMQGFFCQLCSKFYTCRETAKVTHCKTEGHYVKLKAYLVEENVKKKAAKHSLQ